MPQTVNVPGVGQLNFPDGMSQADMAAAIQRNFPQLGQQASAGAATPPVSEGKAQGQRMTAQLSDIASHPGQALSDLATKGLGEVALNAVTGIGSSVAGGFRGLAKLATGGSVDEAAQLIRDTQEKYTYQPKATVGKLGGELLSLPINIAKSAGTEIGGDVGQAVGGDQGRIAGESIGQALPDVAATLAGGRAALRPGRPAAAPVRTIEAPPVVNYDIPAYQRNGAKPAPPRVEPTATPAPPGETPLPPPIPRPTPTPEPLPQVGDLPPATAQKMASPLDRYAAAPDASPYPALAEPVLPAASGAGTSALDQFARNPIEAQRRAVPDQFGDMLREAAPGAADRSPLDAMVAGERPAGSTPSAMKSPLDEMLARDGTSQVAEQLTAGLRDTSDIDATLRQFGVEPPKASAPAPVSAPPMELPPEPTPVPVTVTAEQPGRMPSPIARVQAEAPVQASMQPVEGHPNASAPADALSRFNALSDVGIESKRKSALNGDDAAAAREYQNGEITSQAAGQFWRNQFTHETEAMRNFAQGIVDRTGGKTGLDSVSMERKGMDIAAPYDAARTYFEKAKDALYKEADAAAGGLPNVKLDGVAKLLDTDSVFEGRAEKSALRKGVRAYLREQGIVDADGQMQAITVKTAEGLRKYLNGEWSPQNAGLIGKIKSMLDDDVYASAGEGSNVYAAGRRMHQLEKQTLDNPNGISRLMDSDPYTPINRNTPYEKIPDRIMALSNEQFDHIIKTYRDLPEELQPVAQQAIATLKAHYAERMLNAGTETGRGNPRQLWDVGGVKKFNSDNSAKIPMIFSAEELSDIGKMLRAGEVIRTNPKYPGAEAQRANAAAAGIGAHVARHALGGGIAGKLGNGVIGGVVDSLAARKALADAKAATVREYATEPVKPKNPIEEWEAQQRK